MRIMWTRILAFGLAFLFIGCSGDSMWSSFGSDFDTNNSGWIPTTIDQSRFSNGRLRIGGRCGAEGEILLIMPASLDDGRIIGSPRCSRGRYLFSTSSFGRPPCEVNVEYGSGQCITAKVSGTEYYCR